MTHQPVLLFHIPRTGGTTLQRLLARRFAGRLIFTAGLEGRTHEDDSRMLAAMPADQWRAHAFISGHLEAELLGRDCFAFAFMRHPVQRLVSLYGYVRRTPTHHCHDIVVEQGASLGQFVAMINWDELRNGVTRRFAGWKRLVMPAYDLAILKQAMRNLARLDFVGLQESFDKSLFLLGDALGLEPEQLACDRLNAAPATARLDAPSERELDMIRQCNRMDLELYAFARERFQEASKGLERRRKAEFKLFKQALKAQRGKHEALAA